MTCFRKYFLKLLAVAAVCGLFLKPVYSSGNKPPEEPMVARRVQPTIYKKSAKDVVVSFIDVGQGNCILVQAPSGKTLLYDSGGNPVWLQSTWDPGLQVVVPYLQSSGAVDLDYVVMSHAHGDHIGGLQAVTHNVNVKNFFDPGYQYTSSIYKNLLDTIKQKNIHYGILRAGDGGKIKLGSGIKCRIFNPPADYFFQGTNSDCNNSSVTMKLTYGEVSFLFTGDLEKRGELNCVKIYGNELAANILQVGHHGSYTSSSKIFLSKVQPEVAVIPVGAHNTFGHPSPEALHKLEKAGAEIYRTDYDGTVVVYTDGKKFIVETEK